MWRKDIWRGTAKNPEKGHKAKDPGDEFFIPREGTHGLEFFIDGLDGEAITGESPQVTHIEDGKDDKENQEGTGKAQEKPISEGEGRKVGKVHGIDPPKGEVWRCAHKGGHTADAGRVGDTQHQTGGESLSYFLGDGKFVEVGNDGQAHGDHHHGRGRIGNPHGQKEGGTHKAQNDARRGVSKEGNNPEGHTPVEMTLAHGQGHKEAPHKHKER